MTAITGGVNYSYLGDKTTLFSTILEGNIGGFPIVFFWFIVFAVIFTLLLTRTKFGNHVLAVGGNPTVARNVGVRVERTKILSFALCSLMAGVAAIFYFNRIFFIAPDTQVGIELFGICACVIGGAMVGGGHGNVMGAALGAITVIMLRFGLPMIGVPANLFTAIVGIALLVFAIVHLKMKGMSVG